MSEWLGNNDISRLLGINSRLLLRPTKKKNLRLKKEGRAYLFHKDDLSELIEDVELNLILGLKKLSNPLVVQKYLSQPILYREVEYIVFGFGKTTRVTEEIR